MKPLRQGGRNELPVHALRAWVPRGHRVRARPGCGTVWSLQPPSRCARPRLAGAPPPLLAAPVVNEHNQAIGRVQDIIIAPDAFGVAHHRWCRRLPRHAQA